MLPTQTMFKIAVIGDVILDKNSYVHYNTKRENAPVYDCIEERWQAGEIFEGKTTPHIEEIAGSLKRTVELQTEPLGVYHDKFFRDIVYEGRHRVLGYLLAGREYVPGMMIAGNHPKVLSKKRPEKVEYYRRRIIPVTRFLDYILGKKE